MSDKITDSRPMTKREAEKAREKILDQLAADIPGSLGSKEWFHQYDQRQVKDKSRLENLLSFDEIHFGSNSKQLQKDLELFASLLHNDHDLALVYENALGIADKINPNVNWDSHHMEPIIVFKTAR